MSGDVLHVSGYALMRAGSRAAALAAIERAREAGMRISVDPASAAPLANDPVFLDRIKPIDLLLPNRDEAAVLGPQIDVPELVITQGADGADVDGRDRDRRASARSRSTTSSTPPAPATRSRPGSCPPGPARRRPRWRPACGSRRAR